MIKLSDFDFNKPFYPLVLTFLSQIHGLLDLSNTNPFYKRE